MIDVEETVVDVAMRRKLQLLGYISQMTDNCLLRIVLFSSWQQTGVGNVQEVARKHNRMV